MGRDSKRVESQIYPALCSKGLALTTGRTMTYQVGDLVLTYQIRTQEKFLYMVIETDPNISIKSDIFVVSPPSGDPLHVMLLEVGSMYSFYPAEIIADWDATVEEKTFTDPWEFYFLKVRPQATYTWEELAF